VDDRSLSASLASLSPRAGHDVRTDPLSPKSDLDTLRSDGHCTGPNWARSSASGDRHISGLSPQPRLGAGAAAAMVSGWLQNHPTWRSTNSTTCSATVVSNQRSSRPGYSTTSGPAASCTSAGGSDLRLVMRADPCPQCSVSLPVANVTRMSSRYACSSDGSISTSRSHRPPSRKSAMWRDYRYSRRAWVHSS